MLMLFFVYKFITDPTILEDDIFALDYTDDPLARQLECFDFICFYLKLGYVFKDDFKNLMASFFVAVRQVFVV
jgi:hypothetical protein